MAGLQLPLRHNLPQTQHTFNEGVVWLLHMHLKLCSLQQLSQ